jgi:hypothetical protein
MSPRVLARIENRFWEAGAGSMREKAIFALYSCLVFVAIILTAIDLVAAQIQFTRGELLADIELGK